jgi:hypothetical protein
MLHHLKNAIEKTVKQFKNYPLDYLSERDIQAQLFVELRNETKELRYEYDPGGANAPFGFPRLGLPGPVPIHPVTTEYYTGNGKWDRFDVAVLSDKPDCASAIWRQPCRVAIEIKLWQPGYGEPNHQKDVQKLLRYQAKLQNDFTHERLFTGIAMVFVHPCAEALMQDPISGEKSPEAYPENGVALHFVTRENHWWKQQYPASIPEKVEALAQTT